MRHFQPLFTVLLTSTALLAASGAPTGLATAAPLGAARPVYGQEADLTSMFEGALSSSAASGVEDIWRMVAQVSGAARQLGSDQSTSLATTALSRDDLASGSVLFAAGLALMAAEPDVERIHAKLTGLIESNPQTTGDDHALAAAGLLADEHMRLLDGASLERVLELALGVASSGDRAPALRAESALVLFALGKEDHKRKARRILSDFLKSKDGELRALGALALGRSGAEIRDAIYDELQALAQLPGERGQLAANLLARQKEREKYESSVRKLARAGEDKAPSAGSASQEAQFRAILRIVAGWHLEGDKVQSEELFDSAMDGLLGRLDEHSTYFSPKEYARFEQDLGAYYGGIGAYVGEDIEDKLFTITRPIYSGPAYRAGLMSDDKIVRIGDWSTLGKPVDEIIKRLKGRPGTPVRIYVWRRGMDAGLIDRPTEDMAIEITRESITIPSVQWQILPGNIGMLALNDFSQVAATEMREPLHQMLEAGVRGIVFDLRNNSGGLLEQAGEVAGLFLPKGSLVVKTKSRARPEEQLFTEREPLVPADMPVVVLQNRFSASAAEIVAGALQDLGRATLIGERSFGKGSVQNLITLDGMSDDEFVDENKNGRHDNWETITRDWNGNGEFDFAPRLKLTIARYLLPSGRSIHREVNEEGEVTSPGGIDPDLVVKPRDLQTWRLEEMWRLRSSRAPRDYVDRLIDDYKEREGELKELMTRLADNDQRDPSQYPGFEPFYESLATPLPPDDVRYLVRMEIRRRVQDARSKEFPPGDFVEDLQLQEAIRVVLQKLGQTPEDVPAYTSAIPPLSRASVRLATGDRDRLKQIHEAIARARSSNGQLTPEQLREIDDLVRRQLDN